MANRKDVVSAAFSNARRSYFSFIGSLFEATGCLAECVWEGTVGHAAANGNTVRRRPGLFSTVTTVTGECWGCGGSGRVHGRTCRRCGGTGEYRREYRR